MPTASAIPASTQTGNHPTRYRFSSLRRCEVTFCPERVQRPLSSAATRRGGECCVRPGVSQIRPQRGMRRGLPWARWHTDWAETDRVESQKSPKRVAGCRQPESESPMDPGSRTSPAAVLITHATQAKIPNRHVGIKAPLMEESGVVQEQTRRPTIRHRLNMRNVGTLRNGSTATKLTHYGTGSGMSWKTTDGSANLWGRFHIAATRVSQAAAVLFAESAPVASLLPLLPSTQCALTHQIHL
jgi:hypothetical protein